jgi:IPT/TIG domain
MWWSLARSRSRDKTVEPALPHLWAAILVAACGSTPPAPSQTPPSNVATVSAPIDAPAAIPTAALGANGLKVTAIDPPFGDVDGGTYAVIKGERFMSDGARNVKIYFGTSAGTIVRFQSDHELIVQAPNGTLNEVVDVTVVFEPGGKLKLARAFTFVARVP